jgi:hypothetical protein
MGTFAGITSEAVEARTGKSWEKWLRLLDQAGAAQLPHKEIAALLARDFGVGPWWRQMVAVGYEQARGLRVPHQQGKTFTANVSRTLDAAPADAWAAWQEPARTGWLGKAKMTVRKATPEKSMRITWGDGTHVEVRFYAKSPEKTLVGVEHSKLADEAAVAKSKQFWTAAINRMKRAILPAAPSSPETLRRKPRA